MKIAPLFLLLICFLTACSKKQNDAEIRQKIQGVWIPDFNSDFTWRIKAGGRFNKLYKDGVTNGWTEDGNWTITNRLLVFTMTNRDWPNYVVSDEFYRVVRVDDQEINFISGDMSGRARKVK